MPKIATPILQGYGVAALGVSREECGCQQNLAANLQFRLSCPPSTPAARLEMHNTVNRGCEDRNVEQLQRPVCGRPITLANTHRALSTLTAGPPLLTMPAQP
jgi:hypothetical protein